MRFPVIVVVVGGVLLGVLAFLLAGGTLGTDGTGSETSGATAVSISTPPPVATTIAAPTTTITVPSTTTTEVERGPLVIQGVGDVNFDPGYITAFAAEGYQIAFDGLDGVFLEDDLTVINLECPVSEIGTQLDKQFSFACDPASLPIARANGVDVANLANNHGQDRGVEAMLDSIVNLTDAGIAPVGVGGNLAAASAPALFDIDGRIVAVVGMGGVVPGEAWLATEERPGMASGDDIDLMAASVEAAAEVADIVVVTIHWGVEGVSEPDADDRARAEAMIEAGADVIFGHHPHRLGRLETVNGVPVFWTLGNFVWPRLSDAGATSGIARVVFSPDGTVDACLVPAFIETSGRPELRGTPVCEGER